MINSIDLSGGKSTDLIHNIEGCVIRLLGQGIHVASFFTYNFH